MLEFNLVEKIEGNIADMVVEEEMMSSSFSSSSLSSSLSSSSSSSLSAPQIISLFEFDVEIRANRQVEVKGLS